MFYPAKTKVSSLFYIGISLLVVVLLFTFFDYLIHSMKADWGVPEYYFRDKIPFGFLWGIAGLYVARWFMSIWWKALSVAGIVATTLQVRYFVEGYPLDFVVIFLLFHFIILYILSLVMFSFFASVDLKC